MPIIKESVVVIASPGFGNFFDETDPMFEKPQNRKRMNIIRQGRRDALFLDAIFKVLSLIQALTSRNFQYDIPKLHSTIFSPVSLKHMPSKIKDFHLIS